MNIDIFHHLDTIRNEAFKLPGVTERPCYGTPGFYTGKKLFARLSGEGNILVIYTEERDKWMKQDPETFFITSHYKNYPYMLISLNRVNPAQLYILIETAWRLRAGKKHLQQQKQAG